MILGITGGIGCGKSTTTGFLAARGCRILDSDRIVREQVLTQPEVKEAVRSRYGAPVFTPQNEINRSALAKIVFADGKELVWLEGLTHPRVLEVWRGAFRGEPAASWAVEVPLLFEKALENWFDFTLCVACSLE